MREITYAQALNEALREEMRRDPTVILLGEDIAQHGGAFGITKGLWQEFGSERVRNTPISESAFVGVGLGAALVGMRPVVELMYIDFAALAMDPIVNQAAKMRYVFGGQASAPMVIRLQGGAGRGNAAVHSQSLEMWFVHVPGLKVVQPSTPYDAKGLLIAAIRDNNPVVFIENKLLYASKGLVPEEEYVIPVGIADVKRKGRDVTVVATSRMVLLALSVAKRLSAEGIEVEIIDPRTLKPLDLETIVASVRETGRLVVVNEGCRTGGFGSEVAACVQEAAFDYLDAPIVRITAEDVPIPFSEVLERAAIPSESDIEQAVRNLCC